MDPLRKSSPFARNTTLGDRHVAETNGKVHFVDLQLGRPAGAPGAHTGLSELEVGFRALQNTLPELPSGLLEFKNGLAEVTNDIIDVNINIDVHCNSRFNNSISNYEPSNSKRLWL